MKCEFCEFCEKELNDSDCDNELCKLQLAIKLLELKRDELNLDIEANESKIKELNNIHRLMGITPKGLEMMIRTLGINVPGMNVSVNPAWSWDSISIENAVTLGLHFLQGIERTAREWADFIHVKGLKVQIKSNKEKTTRTLHETEPKPKKVKEPKVKIKLTEFEKIVAHNMKILKLTQEDSIKFVESMGMNGECRDLKEIGAI